jgi:hypothetical protein
MHDTLQEIQKQINNFCLLLRLAFIRFHRLLPAFYLLNNDIDDVELITINYYYLLLNTLAALEIHLKLPDS